MKDLSPPSNGLGQSQKNFCIHSNTETDPNHKRFFYSRDTYFSIGTIVVTTLYFVESGVGPVEFTGAVIYGQPVRRSNLRLDDGFHVPSVRVRALDTCLAIVPIRPVDSTEVK